MFHRIGILIRKYRCKHEKVIKMFPDKVKWYSSCDGEEKHRGYHDGIVILGCLRCGKLWLRDFMA